MKNKNILSALISFLFALQVKAQVPGDYVQGSVILPNGSTIKGFIKDQLKQKAGVYFIADSTSGTKTFYDATSINGATIAGASYQCIQQDFFKVICSGKICFLQKASNSGGKTIYNGADAIELPGTAGKIGDYFSFSDNRLTHITTKTVDHFIATELASCAAADENAKSINGNLALLENAITIYNQSIK